MLSLLWVRIITHILSTCISSRLVREITKLWAQVSISDTVCPYQAQAQKLENVHSK